MAWSAAVLSAGACPAPDDVVLGVSDPAQRRASGGAMVDGGAGTLEQEERWARVAWSFLAEPRSVPLTKLLS